MELIHVRSLRRYPTTHPRSSRIPFRGRRKETGECNFGDRCRFTHGPDDPRFDMDGQRIPTEGKKRKPRKRKPRDPDDPGKKLDEICNNFQAGRCRYGDNCRRQHVGDVPQEPVVKIDEICNNYQEGRCRFGEMCRRQHVDA